MTSFNSNKKTLSCLFEFHALRQSLCNWLLPLQDVKMGLGTHRRSDHNKVYFPISVALAACCCFQSWTHYYNYQPAAYFESLQLLSLFIGFHFVKYSYNYSLRWISMRKNKDRSCISTNTATYFLLYNGTPLNTICFVFLSLSHRPSSWSFNCLSICFLILSLSQPSLKSTLLSSPLHILHSFTFLFLLSSD